MQRKLGDAAFVVVALAVVVAAGVFVRRELGLATPAPTGIERLAPEDTAHVAAAGHLLGSPSATIKIVEFSDFQCPACRTLQGTLRALRARHPNSIAVLYRHYPLSGHPHAVTAAIASECAAAQGRFEPFADSVFAWQDSLAVVSWERLAAQSGVPDTTRFKTCRDDPTAKARLDADVAVGVRIRILGTPALVLGDRLMVGALPLDSLEALIRAAPMPGR
jgi:protein-disulfide isomerase